MKTALISFVAALALTACGAPDRQQQAGADNFTMAMNGASGDVAMSMPGFSGNISVPGMSNSITDFDIDGVELYPGSRIGTMNVDANNGTANVRVGFTSPASVAAVREHLAKGFAAKNMPVEGNASGLNGTTADGDRFTIALSPEGTQTKGLVTIVDAKK